MSTKPTKHDVAPSRHWTTEDLAMLFAHVPALTPTELAAKLHRTPKSVQTRARALGLRWRIKLQHPASFWAKVHKTPGCWYWTGTITDGYGRYHHDKTHTPAHRVAYEMLVGPIPEGMEIDHVRARGCISRSCVNPAHLEPVPGRVNIERGDSPAAINARKTHCIHGHEFTKENTWITPEGARCCRTCKRETLRRWKARTKAQR